MFISISLLLIIESLFGNHDNFVWFYQLIEYFGLRKIIQELMLALMSADKLANLRTEARVDWLHPHLTDRANICIIP